MQTRTASTSNATVERHDLVLRGRGSSVLWQTSAKFSPQVAAIAGEIHNRANQMPGGVTASVWFEEVHYTTGSGWLNINTPPLSSDWNNYAIVKVTEEFYAIWDKKCNT